jgi:hypothetical protein
MELINIIPNPNEFPSIYDFTFVLFGNNGEIRINVRLFDGEEAVRFTKHDIKYASEPKLLARFKWYHRQYDLPLIEEYYYLDFDKEPAVLLKLSEDIDKEPDFIAIFTNENKKYWLQLRKNDSFNERFKFITIDEAERRIAKEMYYNKKQVLFVHPEIIGKEV